MLKTVQAILVSAGLLASFGAVQGLSQTPDDSKMGKMSGSKMSGSMSGSKMTHDEMMAKMDKMTADDKADMMDHHMSMKEKSAAMKMGHDMSKMTAQEKADMFDKMTMEKKMALMRGPMMKNGKMDNMGKMDKKY